MKHLFALIVALVLVAPVAAQRAPLATPIDQDLEREAAHNLDVGRQYFKRKAWQGVKGRLEEILAAYPEFTKIDEVYYLLGIAYVKLDDKKLARETLQKLVDERPDSDYAKKAREELDRLGAP
jgi:outer membrane protein assembly factor BamD (BamD/ComL family)